MKTIIIPCLVLLGIIFVVLFVRAMYLTFNMRARKAYIRNMYSLYEELGRNFSDYRLKDLEQMVENTWIYLRARLDYDFDEYVKTSGDPVGFDKIDNVIKQKEELEEFAKMLEDVRCKRKRREFFKAQKKKF